MVVSHEIVVDFKKLMIIVEFIGKNIMQSFFL